jgi:DNA-binding transcriptional LysR family regulator
VIELRRLQAFVAVAEEGHITRAAERLGMAQPPLSRLIRSLETELGTLLLRRLARGVSLTEAGLALLGEARAVLARAAEVDDTVRRTARGEQGRLAVGFTSSAALHPFVPAALLAFRQAQPGVRVELDEAGTAELVKAMLEGRLDAAFVRSPVGSIRGLIVDPVLDEPMLIALPTGHRLAKKTASALPLAALASEEFILYRRPAGPGLYYAIVTACRGAGFTPVVAQEAPRLPSTLSLVAAGLGISIVPASMQRVAIAGVSFRKLRDCPGLSAPLHLALRRGNLAATAARFRETVRHSAKMLSRQAAVVRDASSSDAR